jgi:hypothetical protein
VSAGSSSSHFRHGRSASKKLVKNCALTGRRIYPSLRANLLEPRLVEPLTTVIIPLDDCILFISLLNCPEFSSRLAEVAQAFDPISGVQFLVCGERVGEPWLFGTIGVRGCSEVWQWRLGSLTQFVLRFVDTMAHIHSFLSKRLAQPPFPASPRLLDGYSIGLEGWFGWSKLHSSDDSFAK